MDEAGTILSMPEAGPPPGAAAEASAAVFAAALRAVMAASGLAAPRLADCKSLALAPARGGGLEVETRALMATGEEEVWEATLRDETAGIAAIYVLTLRSCAAGGGPPAPRPERADPPPSGRSADKLDAILDAAVHVISAKGFGQATIREIASRAEMHAPTLYGHVRSKEHLLELVFLRATDRLCEGLTPRGHDETAEARLRRYLATATDLTDRHRREVGLINREFKNLGPEAQERIVARHRDAVTLYEDILREGVARGEFRVAAPEVIGNMIDAMVDQWALRRFFLSHLTTAEFAAILADFVLSAIRAPDRAPGAPERGA
jgi:AcrR family transcriptional regulator